MVRLLVLLLLLAVSQLSAQSFDVGRVFFDAVPFAADTGERTRLDLFVAVPYGSISFERSDERFVANYRLHLVIRSGDLTVYDTTFDRAISTARAEYASGHAASYDFFQVPVTLEPGVYEAALEIVESRSGMSGTRKRAVTLVDYSKYPFGLSGMLLVGKIREDSTGYVITPMLTDNVGLHEEGYFLFFEAYNSTSPRDVALTVTYRRKDGTAAASQSVVRRIDSGRTQQWIRLRPEAMERGSYVIDLRALDASDTTRVLAATERTVVVEGTESGLPTSEAELDERIAQLRYVALQSEIDELRDEKNFRDRRSKYAEFWKLRDPSPGTAENEAMNQYFSRVDYANEHLRSYAAGWLTDQGRIYIIYGPPDNVSRQPFRSDGRSIEIWQYFSRNLEVRFEDQSGFGDFRLITPVSNLEKYRYQGP